MAYQTIPVPMTQEMATDDFVAICNAMFGGTTDKVGIAAGLGFGSISSVKRFLRGMPISARSATKIASAWNIFVETGAAPKPAGLVDSEDDGTRPFVAVPMARDRQSGRIYTMDKVTSGLVGNVGGPVLSDEEVVTRIDGRFNVMVQIVRRMLRNKVRSMIVQAAAGVGKTFTIEKELKAHKARQQAEGRDFYSKVLSGGGVSPFALYKSLYMARNGGVVVLDDNDSFLDDPEAMNMMKNALDSSEERILTWSKKNSMVKDVELQGDVEEDDDRIPSTFEFKGAMIFITNLDFKGIANSGGARAPHIAAMIDRSFFVDLTIQNLRDKTLWCNHIFRKFMAPVSGLSTDVVEDICGFVNENKNNFFSMSLRLYGAIADLASDPEDGGNWKEIITATKFK